MRRVAPRWVAFLFVAGAVAAPAAIVARPATGSEAASLAQLPARLSDAEFWRLIEDVSEPSGYFLSDNFVSNEARVQHVIPRLQRTLPAGTVYFGVGPEQNLTYIANLEPAMAFIIDIRRQNMMLHLLYKWAMERSPTRADFLALLLSLPKPAGPDTTSTSRELFQAFRQPPSREDFLRNRDSIFAALTARGFALSSDDRRMLEYVYRAFHEAGTELTYNYRVGSGSPGGYSTYRSVQTADNGDGVDMGFLGSEAAYRRLRDLQLRNLVVPVVGDFAGPRALRAMGEYVRSRGEKVGAIYVSNVEEYLFGKQDAPERYYASVAALPLHPKATFIRSAVDGRLIQGGGPAGPVTALAQLLAPVDEFLSLVMAGQIRSYRDVILYSR